MVSGATRLEHPEKITASAALWLWRPPPCLTHE